MTARTPHMRQVEQRIGEDLEAYLLRRFAAGARFAEIAADLAIPKPTLSNWLIRFRISRRYTREPTPPPTEATDP